MSSQYKIKSLTVDWNCDKLFYALSKGLFFYVINEISIKVLFVLEVYEVEN